MKRRKYKIGDKCRLIMSNDPDIPIRYIGRKCIIVGYPSKILNDEDLLYEAAFKGRKEPLFVFEDEIIKI